MVITINDRFRLVEHTAVHVRCILKIKEFLKLTNEVNYIHVDTKCSSNHSFFKYIKTLTANSGCRFLNLIEKMFADGRDIRMDEFYNLWSDEKRFDVLNVIDEYGTLLNTPADYRKQEIHTISKYFTKMYWPSLI